VCELHEEEVGAKRGDAAQRRELEVLQWRSQLMLQST
jgi:hypothetical protein